jgi:hypothetical protein
MGIVVLLRWGGSWSEGLIRDGVLSDIGMLRESSIRRFSSHFAVKKMEPLGDFLRIVPMWGVYE